MSVTMDITGMKKVKLANYNLQT